LIEKIFQSVDFNFKLESKKFSNDSSIEGLDRTKQEADKANIDGNRPGLSQDEREPGLSTPGPSEPANACQCGCCEFWRAKGNRTWKCSRCEPEPKLKSLVADRFVIGEVKIDHEPVVIDHEPVVIFFGQPVCKQCTGSIAEQTIIQNKILLRCWSCRSTDVIDPWHESEFVEMCRLVVEHFG
jgi:hypothetical protein